jgi:hypothetical protein
VDVPEAPVLAPLAPEVDPVVAPLAPEVVPAETPLEPVPEPLLEVPLVAVPLLDDELLFPQP